MSIREWHVYSSDESREGSHELRVMEMEDSDDVMLMIIDGPNPYVCVNEQALLSVLLDLTNEELHGKGVAAPTPLDKNDYATISFALGYAAGRHVITPEAVQRIMDRINERPAQ